MIKRKISVSEASTIVSLEESYQIQKSGEEIYINKQQEIVQQVELLGLFYLDVNKEIG